MLQRLILILFLLAPVMASAQARPSDDSDNGNVSKGCDDKVFTKYEELASLKVSRQVFEDSLKACLKANQALDESAKFVVQFVLTTDSRMLQPERISGSHPHEGFMQCFKRFEKLWVPAVQNKHTVYAYVKCEIQIKQDRLSIRIFQ